MRLVAALAGALLAACSAASANTAMPRSPGAMPDAPLLTSEGGVLRPVENGARLPLKSGYAIVRLSPSPRSMDPDVDVDVFDARGTAVVADVVAEYESLDMDHGVERVQAKPRLGGYRMRLSFAMQGSWRVVIHITRGIVEDTVTLVLPSVGL